MEYLHNWWVWITHTLNVITGGKASEDFSSRCYRREAHWFFKLARPAVDFIFGEAHCYKAYLQELEPKSAWERH